MGCLNSVHCLTELFEAGKRRLGKTNSKRYSWILLFEYKLQTCWLTKPFDLYDMHFQILVLPCDPCIDAAALKAPPAFQNLEMFRVFARGSILDPQRV